ncbi:MAG: magnesium transporter [Ruminococcaceae bacterium]|nr:magnesium transporter [Oscillospiraceae bacterium]
MTEEETKVIEETLSEAVEEVKDLEEVVFDAIEESKVLEETLYNAVTRCLEDKQFATIRTLLADVNYVDIEALLAELEPDAMLRIFRMLSKETAAEVFAEMDSDMQQYIVESITDREVDRIVDELYMDDAVDFLEEMPANVVRRVLRNTDETKRKIINHLLQYPEDSAGSLMTIEFVDLKKEMTAQEALERIRQNGVDKETINTCYVVSPQRMLEGVVSIRTLILSQPETKVEDLMDINVKYIHTLDDQETSAFLFRKYDLLSMPVVDRENRLVGIITVDDMMDVIEQENTEDFHKMAAITPSEEPYLKTGVFTLAKNRVMWLLVLMISATFTGSIIRHFEGALSEVVVLTTYIPMLMGTAGNAGAQSSTMIIRSLALNELDFSNILKVIWKELRVGAVTAGLLAIVNMARIMIFDHVSFGVALAVCLSLFCIVCLAKVVGGMLPILADKIHLDPVLMASPIITTILDALSLLIYFRFATAVLGIA